MCGIAGCVGLTNATEFVTDSLEALEYRGYDSIGLAYPNGKKIKFVKTLGGVNDLRINVPKNSATTALGHTRWATHGKVAIVNTHPHMAGNNTIAVVHNGVFENHAALRELLVKQGVVFQSETDTEVLPQLLNYYVSQGSQPEVAVEKALQDVEGAYAILIQFSSQPDTLYAARLGSPLVLGINDEKREYLAASDPSVLIDHTQKAIFMNDNEIAILSSTGYSIKHIHSGDTTTRDPELISDVYEKAVLGEYHHYMLKEIHDSPETVRSALSGRIFPAEHMVKLGGLTEVKEQLRDIDRIIILACGTSYHAGLIGERLIEELAGIPVEVQLASEFKYRQEPFNTRTAAIAISQSGETADTIGALEKAGEFGMLKLGIINSPGSTIDRITDAGVHCRAGKEVSVVSTKALTSQLVILAEIALALAKNSTRLQQPIMEALVELPAKIEEILKSEKTIAQTAKSYAHFKNFLYIGRGYEHATALEGALKLKESSYVHAEGASAGEMKHGTLALIDEDFPTLAIATNGAQYQKTISNIQEIKARGGPLVALASEGNVAIESLVHDVLYVPDTVEQLQPILNNVVLQLFAYYIAVEKGVNVDRPRNLAKSVTVE